MPKAGRLCEYTIARLPPVEGGPAYFEVTDLSLDDRFKDLPFVSGNPGFRYYCGVPLRTKKGINIGSLFVLDVKAREPASLVHVEVLAALAHNCMVHLQMLRDEQAKKRSLKMKVCLAAFVDPDQDARKRKDRLTRKSSSEQPLSQSSPTGRAEHSGASRGSSDDAVAAIKATRKKRSFRRSINEGDRQSTEGSSASDSEDIGVKTQVGENEYAATFERAADLLRESLTLEDGGGVVLLAPSMAFQVYSTSDETSGEEAPQRRQPNSERRGSRPDPHVPPSGLWGTRKHSRSANAHDISNEPAQVLASSWRASVSDSEPPKNEKDIGQLSSADVTKLVKRYPRGKLFLFGGEDLISSSSSGDEQLSSSKYIKLSSKSSRASKAEAAMLVKQFPGARQIIFLPIWDSTTSNWCTCFAVNTSEFRYFRWADFLHGVAFGNCIMAEISRMASINADSQKSDFIGSVSHELRSPLHGILASCEFLLETGCDTFQRSLVDTADACARTLLDTLNMVLDYSKINHFERSLGMAQKSRKHATAAILAGRAPTIAPSLNIYGSVDLGIITEEVVEGVASGHYFKDSMDTIDSGGLPSLYARYPGQPSLTKSPPRAPVEIILDLTARDWTFVTQPGKSRPCGMLNHHTNPYRRIPSHRNEPIWQCSQVHKTGLHKNQARDARCPFQP